MVCSFPDTLVGILNFVHISTSRGCHVLWFSLIGKQHWVFSNTYHWNFLDSYLPTHFFSSYQAEKGSPISGVYHESGLNLTTQGLVLILIFNLIIVAKSPLSVRMNFHFSEILTCKHLMIIILFAIEPGLNIA